MTVLRDTFASEAAARLTGSGWVLTDASRYDPTVLNGLTPSGRAFSATLTRDGALTITIAGRTRTATVAAETHESGLDTVTAILDAYSAYPANQR